MAERIVTTCPYCGANASPLKHHLPCEAVPSTEAVVERLRELGVYERNRGQHAEDIVDLPVEDGASRATATDGGHERSELSSSQQEDDTDSGPVSQSRDDDDDQDQGIWTQ